MGMFDLSTKGFRQVFADRSVSRMVEELVANAFDENVSRVDVAFEHLERVMNFRRNLPVEPA